MHTELALQYAGCATSAVVTFLAVSNTRTLLKHVAARQLAQHSARFAPQRTLGPCKRHVRHGMHVIMRARAFATMAYAAGAGNMRARQLPHGSDAAEPLISSAEAEKEATQLPRQASRPSQATLSRGDWLVVAILTVLALMIRFFAIAQPSSVVFDEVHFGGFAAKYLKRQFFMDVHPPLAKLLITLAAWIGGFKGEFDFSHIGTEYLATEGMERVPYVLMRSVGALFGAGTVPLAYLTVRGLGARGISALVAASFVALDNAMTTQSRLILLDAPLVFFIALSIYAWVAFSQIDARAPFTRPWWAFLALTGAALGLAGSVKWVGLFTVASIGLAVIVQLWEHLGDLRVSIRTMFAHFAARALCLIVLPLTVYTALFSIHFAILDHSGTGDGFMSWPFRHSLRGNRMPDTPAHVALGSRVQIMHYNTLGGYLHSHPHSYETGSTQQQITLYPFKDTNNEWYIIEAPASDDELERDNEDNPIRPDDEVTRYFNTTKYVRDGMEIRLLHVETDVRLHSHNNHRPPVTEADYQDEVTGYGAFSDYPKFGGDANDDWRIFIYAQERIPKRIDNDQIVAMRTIFQLYHPTTDCYLFSHPVNLPEWGFKQQEVTCNHEPTLPNSLWYIETVEHPLVNATNSPMVNYIPPGFWSKFFELQGTMWTRNQQITAHHAYESRPESWPFLYRGINFWTKHHRQIYLMGNPFVWWTAATSVVIVVVARIILTLRAKRQFNDFNNATVVYYDRTCIFLLVGWLLHYVPFIAMSRQLFIHHYLPALYCSILLFAVVFDAMTGRLRPRFRAYCALGLIGIAFLFFLRYAPITYALPWANMECGNAIMRKSWDFNCIDMPMDKSEYKNYPPVVEDPLAGTRPHSHLLDRILPQQSSNTVIRTDAAQPGRPAATTMTASGAAPFGDLSAKKNGTTSSSTTVQHAGDLDPQKLREAIVKGTSILSRTTSKTSSSTRTSKK